MPEIHMCHSFSTLYNDFYALKTEYDLPDMYFCLFQGKVCKLSASQYLLQKARENKTQKSSGKKVTGKKGTNTKSKVSANKLKKSGKGVKSAVKMRGKSDEENRKPSKKRKVSKESDDSVVVLDDMNEEKHGKKKAVKRGVAPKKKAPVKSPRKATPKKTGGFLLFVV
jgi:hypothetical protein